MSTINVQFGALLKPKAKELPTGVLGELNLPWTNGTLSTASGEVPIAKSVLNRADTIGSWKARWGIGRMRFAVKPGLYAVGKPTADSPVFVSANYKMSFDRLRAAIDGLDGWVLAIDTDGINVWCAAGKGTFSDSEIVARAKQCSLERIVNHRKIIVPQLGAPGVDAKAVKGGCGFMVIYGPVLATDIAEFMQAGMKATPPMRQVNFTLKDRAVLVPIETMMGMKYAFYLAVALFLLSGFGPGIYRAGHLLEHGFASAAIVLGTFILSAALAPLLLPWLPGRAFALKGIWVGLAIVLLLKTTGLIGTGMVVTASWALIIVAVASFITMNFTGASTFTSLNGVMKEMKTYVPVQLGSAVIGLGLFIWGRFLI